MRLLSRIALNYDRLMRIDARQTIHKAYRRCIEHPYIIVFFSFYSFVLWLVPWIIFLRIGFVIYFPYAEDGKTRFTAAAGPHAARILKRVNWAEDIPQHCTAALVAAEDTRFYEHRGIDTQVLREIARTTLRTRRRPRSGGSTITQQLIKNVFLSRHRSLLRKGREIIGALLAECILSKDEIIHWYFNVVEFAPNTYGITAASRLYFNKAPQNLTTAECISLVAILPNPKRWGFSLRHKKALALRPATERKHCQTNANHGAHTPTPN